MKMLLILLVQFASQFTYSQHRNPELSGFARDLELIKASLIEGHPVLHKHFDEKSFNKEFDKLSQKVKRGIDDRGFYLFVSAFVAKIRDGHTRLLLSDDYRSIIDNRHAFLPLKLKFMLGRMYVIENYTDNVIVDAGDEIITINGIRSNKLIKQLLTLVTADEGNPGFLQRRLDLEHADLIPILLNLPRSYVIKGKKLSGKMYEAKFQSATTAEVKTARSKKYAANANSSPWEYKLKRTVDKEYAMLNIRNFSSGPNAEYLRFLDSVFDDLNNKNIQQLLIDLRENTGGYDGNAAALLQHLVGEQCKYYSETCIKQIQYDFLSHTNAAHYNKMIELFKPRPRSDGMYNITLLWEEQLNKRKIAGYKGQVYFLINERSFSSACLVAVGAFNQTNAIFVGEPTGGSYHGSSGATVLLQLPYSKFSLQLPLVSSIYYTVRESSGKGLPPTFRVTPTIKDLVENRDPAMEFVMQQINGKNPVP